MALTRTRQELVNAALGNLGILAAGQIADAEDFQAVNELVDSLVAWLEASEIVDIDNIEEIPLNIFDALANLLADDAALQFGMPALPVPPNASPARQSAIDDIRLATYARPTYERQKTEYF